MGGSCLHTSLVDFSYPRLVRRGNRLDMPGWPRRAWSGTSQHSISHPHSTPRWGSEKILPRGPSSQDPERGAPRCCSCDGKNLAGIKKSSMAHRINIISYATHPPPPIPTATAIFTHVRLLIPQRLFRVDLVARGILSQSKFDCWWATRALPGPPTVAPTIVGLQPVPSGWHLAGTNDNSEVLGARTEARAGHRGCWGTVRCHQGSNSGAPEITTRNPQRLWRNK